MKRTQSALDLINELISHASPERANISERFFKTGKGQYGEGDIFLGLTMPQIRILIKQYINSVTLDDVDVLLRDKHHEMRMAGVLLMVAFAQKKTYPLEEVARFYMDHATCINNWDLVDASSEHIIGPYLDTLSTKEKKKFIAACISHQNLWVNRIIVLATFHGIKRGDGKLIFEIAERMMGHKHDLMHKAIGWMLRESGKRCSIDALRKFLDTYAHKMPRTMLRYAIEKMDTEERRKYMFLGK